MKRPIASISGDITVAHALGDPDVIRDEAVRLAAWIDSIDSIDSADSPS